MNDARGTIPPGPPGAPQMGRVPFSRHHAPLASGQPLRDSHQLNQKVPLSTGGHSEMTAAQVPTLQARLAQAEAGVTAAQQQLTNARNAQDSSWQFIAKEQQIAEARAKMHKWQAQISTLTTKYNMQNLGLAILEAERRVMQAELHWNQLKSLAQDQTAQTQISQPHNRGQQSHSRFPPQPFSTAVTSESSPHQQDGSHVTRSRSRSREQEGFPGRGTLPPLPASRKRPRTPSPFKPLRNGRRPQV